MRRNKIYIMQYAIFCHNTGSEANLPEIERNRLSELKAQGYELVIKPTVSISGRRPGPVMLFIKFDNVSNRFDFTDCIYIDNKYSLNTQFSNAQNQILNNFDFNPNRPWAEVVGIQRVYSVSGREVEMSNQILRIKKIQTFSIDDNFDIITQNIKP